eukprot:356258-Chlamydomonas_euryale.AAC.7
MAVSPPSMRYSYATTATNARGANAEVGALWASMHVTVTVCQRTVHVDEDRSDSEPAPDGARSCERLDEDASSDGSSPPSKRYSPQLLTFDPTLKAAAAL